VTALVDQLPALVGVLIGTGGTVFATWVADRARWRRGQTVRWDERRLQAYVEYANALKEVHSYALRLVDSRTPGPGLSDVERNDVLARLVEADLRRTKAWESVLLLGDAATVTAARNWREAVGELTRRVRGFVGEDLDVVAAVTRVNECRDRFYEVARSNLGIAAGFVAQSEWLAKGVESSPG
jgi:hypothetical protein